MRVMWLARVDAVVAGRADHEGLAPHPGHLLRPRGRWLSRPGEIGELADLVCLHAGPCAAEFAPACAEPGDQLLAAGGRGDRTVVDDGLPLPCEGYPAEPCDQWFPALALYLGLKAPAFSVGGGNDGLVFTGHLRHGGAVLGGQGLEHGCLHDPAQPVQPGDVPGEQVVLDNAPVPGPVAVSYTHL